MQHHKGINGLVSIVLFLASVSLLLSQPASRGVPVRITALDPSKDAVPGAALQIAAKDSAKPIKVTANSAGVVTVRLQPGSYTATAVAPELLTENPMNFTVRNSPMSLNIYLMLRSLQTTVQVEALNPPSLAQQTVSATDLARSPAPGLAEQLKNVPGLDTVRRGANNQDPVLTGLRQTQIATIVDGTRTFAAGPARMDSELSHVDSGNVKSVTVVKGPYALTKGAGALSAIEVETNPVPFYQQWTIGGKISSGYSFNSSDRYARTNLFAANSRFGFEVFGAGSKGNNYVAGERGGIQQSVPARFGGYQGGGKIRLGITDNQELNFSGSYDDQTGLDYPGNLLNATFLITRSWNGDYYFKHVSSLLDQVHVKLYLDKKGHRMNNDGKPTALDVPGRMPPFGLKISVPTTSNTWGGAVSAAFHLSPHLRFDTGLDFYNLNQNALRFISRRSNGAVLFRDTVWPDASVADQGFYFSATNQWERATLAGTLRLDAVQARARTPSSFFLQNVAGPLATSEVHPSFSLLANYRLVHSLSVSAGAGRAVRTANVLERYSDRFPSSVFQTAAEFLGDPRLQPEVSYQANVGVEMQVARVTLNGSVFYRRLENFITAAPDAGIPKESPLSPNGVYRYLNGDHANFRGFDYGLRYRILPSLELRTQGAYTLADEISAGIPAVGVNQPLFGIPPLNFRHALRYAPWRGRLWGQFTVRNAINQNRVSYTRFEQPTSGYTTYSAEAGFTIRSNATLYAGVDNFANKFYYQHLNSFNPYTGQPIPLPGRNVYVGLTCHF